MSSQNVNLRLFFMYFLTVYLGKSVLKSNLAQLNTVFTVSILKVAPLITALNLISILSDFPFLSLLYVNFVTEHQSWMWFYCNFFISEIEPTHIYKNEDNKSEVINLYNFFINYAWKLNLINFGSLSLMTSFH